MMLSITLMPLNSARFWNVRATPISATWRLFRQRQRHAVHHRCQNPFGGCHRQGLTGAADMTHKKIGDVILDIKNISLRFGGVKALTDISFDVREHEIRSIIGPTGPGAGPASGCRF